MKPMTRRSLLAPAAAGALIAAASAPRAQAQLVYQRSDWKLKDFQQLLSSPAHMKQVYDVTAVNGGKFLSSIKNCLNGLHYGFGIATDQIQIVAGLHGASNMVNFDDAIWEKYRIGEAFQIEDPATGKPAVRNPFYRSTTAKGGHYASQDPSDDNSLFQDSSIEALRSRGVQFLSCHTASEEQAKMLIHRWKLGQKREDIVKDLNAHTLPHVLVVPSMVASISMLQTDGHYAYLQA